MVSGYLEGKRGATFLAGGAGGRFQGHCVSAGLEHQEGEAQMLDIFEAGGKKFYDCDRWLNIS